MTSIKDIWEYTNKRQKKQQLGRPVYCIMLFENPDKELVYTNPGTPDKPSGFPDTGSSEDVGFFHSLKDAIEALETNMFDMREGIYNAGFILAHFQGIYETAGTNERMYFVWDDEKQGFVQKEEPAIFAHVAY